MLQGFLRSELEQGKVYFMELDLVVPLFSRLKSNAIMRRDSLDSNSMRS